MVRLLQRLSAPHGSWVISRYVLSAWYSATRLQIVSYTMQVKVTQRIQGYESPQDIRRLKRGDYFGERALLRSVTSSLPAVDVIESLIDEIPHR